MRWLEIVNFLQQHFDEIVNFREILVFWYLFSVAEVLDRSRILWYDYTIKWGNYALTQVIGGKFPGIECLCGDENASSCSPR